MRRSEKPASRLPSAPAKTASRVPSVRSITQRSRVTNGSATFVQGDERSKWTRRYKDLVSAHAVDSGGPDVLSQAQISLIQRASALEVALEVMEGMMSEGKEVNLDLYSRVTNTLRRVLESLGLKRVQRELNPPSVDRYIAHHRSTEPREEPNESPAPKVRPRGKLTSELPRGEAEAAE